MRLPLSASQKGFTLLELMIVMFIIIILASVSLPQYMKTVQHAKESVLIDTLYQIKRMIRQYQADKGKLPQKVQDLVEAGYFSEMPVDPMTGKPEWDEDCSDCRQKDPNSTNGEMGLIRVRSLSTDKSLPNENDEIKSYNEF